MIFKSEFKEYELHAETGSAWLTIGGRRRQRDGGRLLGADDYLVVEHVPAPWRKAVLSELDEELVTEFREMLPKPGGKQGAARIRKFIDILLREDYDLAKKILEGSLAPDDVPACQKYASYNIRGTIFGFNHGRITSQRLFRKLRELGFTISPGMLRQALESGRRSSRSA
jgi:hypothetical protein